MSLSFPQAWTNPMLSTLALNGWSLLKIPMIAFIGPRVTEISDEACTVKIPLKRTTKNHYGSLYISCQVTGAELPPGILAMRLAQKKGIRVGIIYKDIKGSFKKRPDNHTFFRCVDGDAISRAIDVAYSTGERQNQLVRVVATCPPSSTVVTEFEFVLSLKKED